MAGVRIDDLPPRDYEGRLAASYDCLTSSIAGVLSRDEKEWEIMFSDDTITLARHKKYRHRYAVDIVFMRDPAITFKYFSNERYWTAMPLVVETARCLEQIDESTKVIYGSSHHYGPIKARSCVAIARTREDPAQGVWEHYGSWCDHDAAPDLHSKHHPKRLHPTFGGYRIYAFDSPLLASSAPVKGFDGASCRVVACGEADPGAWVPDMFIRFVAKQVLPTTIALVNKTLKRAPAVPPETVGTVDIHAPDVDSAPAEVGPAVAASAESQKSHAIIERPRAKVGRVAGVVERARRALEWASPFIVTFLFVTSLVALFRDRRRRRARLALM